MSGIRDTDVYTPAQSSEANSDRFQILARRPVESIGHRRTAVERVASNTDPLRETLPWPLPEGMQEQLAMLFSEPGEA